MSSATLPDLLARSTAQAPQAPALIYLDRTIDYVTLHDHVERAAAGLAALGVCPGERVALMLPNCPQFVIAYFAVLRVGAIVTATSPIYTAREAAHQWNDAGAVLVISDSKFAETVSAARAHCPELRQVVFTWDSEYTDSGFARLSAALSGAGRDLTPAHATDIAWVDLLKNDGGLPPATAKHGDIACLQYTGGTTGVSKGAMLTHANLIANIAQTRDRLTDGKGGKEFSVAALPMFHIFAMTCVMLSALESGGTVLIVPRFEPRAVLAEIRRHRPHFFHGVPTMYVGFLGVPELSRDDLTSLLCCVSGGAPMPLEVIRRFEKLLTHARIVEGYGLSECSPVTHFNSCSSPRPGSIGRPVKDTEARVVDLEHGTRDMPLGEPGELLVRGPQVMTGYWRNARETDLALACGWLRTGDIVVRDADDFYTIVDRKKDMIIAGGFNIYPREVEEALFEHPQVREALVIGVPDTYRGETVKAFLALKPGATVSTEEIVAFCRDRLAAYKVPRIVEIRDALPKSGVGKLLRRELRREEIENRAATARA